MGKNVEKRAEISVERTGFLQENVNKGTARGRGRFVCRNILSVRACIAAVFCISVIFLFYFAIGKSDVSCFTFFRNASGISAAAENTSNGFDGEFDDMGGLKGNFDGMEIETRRKNDFSEAEKILVAAVGILVIAVLIVQWRKGKKERIETEEMQKTIEKAMKFAETDELFYVDVADMLKNGKNRFLYAEEDGVLFQDDRGFYEKGTYVFAAENDAVARKILLSLPFEERKNVGQGVLACHGEKIAEICKEFFGYDRVTPCYQVVYDCNEKRELKGLVRFEKLSEKYLPLVIRTYDKESPDALKRLAEKGMIEAAFATIDGEEKFVGYIGQHPEGSMGMLYVFPEFRRRGYASELESREINIVSEEGRVPYAHIIEDNYKSFALQNKLGAKVASDKVVWMSNSARKKDR